MSRHLLTRNFSSKSMHGFLRVILVIDRQTNAFTSSFVGGNYYIHMREYHTVCLIQISRRAAVNYHTQSKLIVTVLVMNSHQGHLHVDT